MLKFTKSERTCVIANVLRTLPFGGSMTYKALSESVGFPVVSTTSHYRSAMKFVLREGVSIAAADPKISFRRRTTDEMAEGKHRFTSIRRTAKRGSFEAKEALKSNDLRTQGKASIAAAKYSMLSGMKPVSNRDVPSNLLPVSVSEKV
jgi:hypothetical protein